MISKKTIETINKKEIRKLSRIIKYPKPNLPTPAVLVVCCLMESISNDGRIDTYIGNKMPKLKNQLDENNSSKSSQINNLDCNKLHKKKNKKCRNSMDILYNHLRSGLVHDYFNSKRMGVFITNKPSKEYANIIVDQSETYKGENLHNYALVINGPAFVHYFLETL